MAAACVRLRLGRYCEYRYYIKIQQVDLLFIFIGIITTCFAISSTISYNENKNDQKSDDVSIKFILVMVICLQIWMIYGIEKDGIVLIR